MASGFSDDWRIETSESGWTNEKLGLIWLKEVFDKGAQALLHGELNHSSLYARSLLPSSAALDVGCYSPLKQVYKKEVEKQMRLGINHIDKDEFLTIYSSIRPAALSEKNIQSGFRATGLVPYDPEQVLAQLSTHMDTPTPPGTSHSSQASWAAATPHSVQQLELQSEKVKKYLKRVRRVHLVQLLELWISWSRVVRWPCTVLLFWQQK
ncbi:hypothetical protein VTO42DRAFT_4077 [Malbranchea cinnamomea]